MVVRVTRLGVVSDQVAERVRAAIEDHGPIGFDEYMELTLYGPGGFFEAPPVGSSGHFVTSPHVHPFVFAHCLRDAILDAWFALGEPDPLQVVELGAGDGTLAASLLSAFGELPTPRPSYTGVEISAGARDALRARGLATASRLSELEPFEGVVLANEVLDNLPFLPVRERADGPAEVRVGLEGTALVEIEVPWSNASVPPPRLRPGEETSVPVGAFALLAEVARVLRRGYVLVIDYGSVSGPAGPVHGYREHREVTDVLADPGGTDVTAGVDVSQVAERARSLGLRPFEPVTQSQALAALGHNRWDRTMIERQAVLQSAGRGSEAVAVWEARHRASLLADPSGLGGFWWLVLATHGLPEPPWLRRARRAPLD
jgi:NADH dehydrogenase [ubiquinone] 1 alpha subcomplex assembly factor 7